MPYFVISNFRDGVDTRSPVYAQSPGTLSIGQDLHLTEGGHLQKRKAFVPVATLPTNSFGLAAVRGEFWCFGSQPGPAEPIPSGYFYQPLPHPTGLSPMTDLLDVELFDGEFYVIGKYGADTVHFYDGTRITDWLVAGETDAGAFIGGKAAKTLGDKVYAIAGANLHFSATLGPTFWRLPDPEADPPDPAGSGFINMATNTAGAEELVGLEVFYDRLAILSKENIQIFSVAADPTDNTRQQTLRGVGLVGPRAALSYLDGDTYVVSYSGVKAITVRDSSGRARLENVSAKIDKELQPFIKGLSPDERAKAILLTEPEGNRLWVILGNRIHVLNWFPDERIKGWTEYRPGFVIEWAVVVDQRIYVRSGDTVYLYGGENDDQYFSGTAIARLPYLDLRAPATFKSFYAVDVGCEGSWEVWLGERPDDAATYAKQGIAVGQTYDEPAFPLVGTTTHVSMELRHTGNENASVSAVSLHYRSNEST
jgi:hypothetical protein